MRRKLRQEARTNRLSYGLFGKRGETAPDKINVI